MARGAVVLWVGIAIALNGCGGSSGRGGTGGAAGALGKGGASGGPGDAGIVFVPGQPFRQTYVLSDVTSTSFTLEQAWTSGTVTARSHETAAVSASTATFTQTCPAPDAGIDWGGSSEFTATSSSITLFWSRVDGIIEVRAYDKRPDPG